MGVALNPSGGPRAMFGIDAFVPSLRIVDGSSPAQHIRIDVEPLSGCHRGEYLGPDEHSGFVGEAMDPTRTTVEPLRLGLKPVNPACRDGDVVLEWGASDGRDIPPRFKTLLAAYLARGAWQGADPRPAPIAAIGASDLRELKPAIMGGSNEQRPSESTRRTIRRRLAAEEQMAPTIVLSVDSAAGGGAAIVESG